ncbi:MAG: CTP synthase [Pseudobutyrivibrio sp.]|nr:CTP synthase [Pseudobutyrivibrio sp.]
MRIRSAFLRGVASKLIKKLINRKLGYDVTVKLNGFDVSIGEDGDAKVRLNLELDCPKEEVKKFFAQVI